MKNIDLVSSKYTLLICSNDAYEDAWDPLFILLKRYWLGLENIPIILNTQTKEYKFDGLNIISPQLYKKHFNSKMLPWSKILRDTLIKVVKTKLVLIYLDDFFLRSPVNVDRLNKCLEFMEEHPNAANITLATCPQPYSPTEEYPWLVKRSKSAPYLFCLQAGLWRRDRLLHFLRDHESPWYFERWGSLRGRRYLDDFYALTLISEKQAIFDYDASIQGIKQGQWQPETSDLFFKEGIDIDLSKMGIITLNNDKRKIQRNWLKTAWAIFQSLRP